MAQDYDDYSRIVEPVVNQLGPRQLKIFRFDDLNIAAGSAEAYIILYDFSPFLVGGGRFEVSTTAKGLQRYAIYLISGGTDYPIFKGNYSNHFVDDSFGPGLCVFENVSGYKVEIYNDSLITRSFSYSLILLCSEVPT